MKLELRYGDGDALVMQVKQELATHELLQAKHTNWSKPYREFIKSAASTVADPSKVYPAESAIGSP